MTLGLPGVSGSPAPNQLQRRSCQLPAGAPMRAMLWAGQHRRIPRSMSPGSFRQSRIPAATRSSAPQPIPGPLAAQQPGHGLVGSLPFNEEEYLEVGRVTAAHGVRGELKLEVSTDEPEQRFKAGKRLYLLPPAAQGLTAAAANSSAPLMIKVTCRGTKVRPVGKGEEVWMVALDEVSSRTQAELLKGYVVYCAAADRGKLRDPDEFYVSDIIGCTVLDQASRRMIGLVVDVYSGMGTYDTLRVKLRATEQDILKSRIRYCMVPFAKAICPVMDLKNRTLEVVLPEGLLDLSSEEPLKKPLSEEAKAEKLQQLRNQLRREEEQLRQQRQVQQHPQQSQHQQGAPMAPAAQAAASGSPTSGATEGAARPQDEGRARGRQPRGKEVIQNKGDGEDEEKEDEDEDEDEEGTVEEAEGEGSARLAQARRPGLRRRRMGGLRLGLRRG